MVVPYRKYNRRYGTHFICCLTEISHYRDKRTVKKWYFKVVWLDEIIQTWDVISQSPALTLSSNMKRFGKCLTSLLSWSEMVRVLPFLWPPCFKLFIINLRHLSDITWSLSGRLGIVSILIDDWFLVSRFFCFS